MAATASANALGRYHRVHLHPLSLTDVDAVLLRCSCKHGIFIATRANYAHTKALVVAW